MNRLIHTDVYKRQRRDRPNNEVVQNMIDIKNWMKDLDVYKRQGSKDDRI